jgi:hypothetical protein
VTVLPTLLAGLLPALLPTLLPAMPPLPSPLLMAVTVAIYTLKFKHVFEESWILSDRWGRTSYRCSIERTFDTDVDQEDQMSAMTWTDCPPRPARAARPVRQALAARPVRQAPAAAPVRLTRRGRLVVLAMLLGLVLGLLVVAMAQATATSDRGDSVVAERVTVRPGETLWAIAERVRPDADPRATIARIKDMNGLRSGAAQAGQVLLVPAGS